MPGLDTNMLGHYRLICLLGEGGMAEVYLGYDDHLHREVAIKVVHQSKDEHVRRFQREAEILGPLAHEHILQVFAYGEQGPWRYLVMPYVAGGTLLDRLNSKGYFSLKGAGVLLAQLAEALQWAHDRGVLHRDIKPSNILLRDEAFAYLADFGIAKALEHESQLTQTGVVPGTPDYMAPELLETTASSLSEVYALGVVLYQMLTNHLPFEGNTPAVTLMKHLQGAPLRPSLFNPEISPAIEQVILHALDKDPQQRFQTTQALASAYQQALEETLAYGSVSRPDATTFPGRRHVEARRREFQAAWASPRHLVLFASIGVLLLLFLFLGLLMRPDTPNHPVLKPVNPVLTPMPQVHTALPSITPTPTKTPSPTAIPDPCSGGVSLQDMASILRRKPVCTMAKTLPYQVLIYTTSTLPKGTDFNQMTKSLVTSPQMVVIAIDEEVSPPPPDGGPTPAPHIHISIAGGMAVSISDTRYHQAMDTFNQVAQTGDYTQATVDAIRVLQTPGS
ncbi:MAG TPA: serine/threonine-protein kinase [Ktedonobacteraceae bacterium]|nr:serine/threonine-protein kinase [Ktedonobacteraceae bacterium]